LPRTYIVRLENGQLTPGIRRLERIADVLGIGLQRFFVSDDLHRDLLVLEDPFVMAVGLFVHDLNEADRARILEVLAAAPKVTK
jgi:transcriptional regulator with XRE-family HTH domain